MLNGGCSFQALILKTTIKAMVIDHRTDCLAYVRNLLESHSFEVTCVDHAAAALEILSKKKDRFDLLLIDGDLRHVDLHTFLRLTNDMGTLSTVMYEEQDDVFLLKAFKNGASHVFKKPITEEGVMQVRNFVFKERLYNFENFKKLAESEKTKIECANSSGRRKDKSVARNDIRNTRGNVDVQLIENDVSSKKNTRLEWTEELHAKFLNAVTLLGEERCFPKPVLEIMGVPGLTRMQVASHLQKCRHDGWGFNGKRGIASSSKNMLLSSNQSYQEGGNSRRFNRMPHVATNLVNKEERISPYDATLSSYGRQLNVNQMNNQSVVDPSMMNGFRYRNMREAYSALSAGQSANPDTFPPNPVTDDFDDMLKEIGGNALVVYNEVNVPPSFDKDPTIFNIPSEQQGH